jgi:hypothetical protein
LVLVVLRLVLQVMRHQEDFPELVIFTQCKVAAECWRAALTRLGTTAERLAVLWAAEQKTALSKQ